MKVPQTCIPCWSYNIPLTGRSLFYSTRFFDLSRLPLCVQKDIVADLCQLPQTQCQGFPHARLRRSALGEAELGCGWRQQVLLPCVWAACLEAWGPHLLQEGRVPHLGWMNTSFSERCSSPEELETPGKIGCRGRGRNVVSGPCPHGTSQLLLCVFPEHPCLLLAPTHVLGHGWHRAIPEKKYNKKKSFSRCYSPKGSYIQASAVAWAWTCRETIAQLRENAAEMLLQMRFLGSHRRVWLSLG